MKTIAKTLEDKFMADDFADSSQPNQTNVERLELARKERDAAVERAVKAGLNPEQLTKQDKSGKVTGYSIRVPFNCRVAETKDDLGEFTDEILVKAFNGGYDLERRGEVRDLYKDSPKAKRTQADIGRINKQAKILGTPNHPLFAELLQRMQTATTAEGVQDLQAWLDKAEV